MQWQTLCAVEAARRCALLGRVHRRAAFGRWAKGAGCCKAQRAVDALLRGHRRKALLWASFFDWEAAVAARELIGKAAAYRHRMGRGKARRVLRGWALIASEMLAMGDLAAKQREDRVAQAVLAIWGSKAAVGASARVAALRTARRRASHRALRAWRAVTDRQVSCRRAAASVAAARRCRILRLGLRGWLAEYDSVHAAAQIWTGRGARTLRAWRISAAILRAQRQLVAQLQQHRAATSCWTVLVAWRAFARRSRHVRQIVSSFAASCRHHRAGEAFGEWRRLAVRQKRVQWLVARVACRGLWLVLRHWRGHVLAVVPMAARRLRWWWVSWNNGRRCAALVELARHYFGGQRGVAALRWWRQWTLRKLQRRGLVNLACGVAERRRAGRLLRWWRYGWRVRRRQKSAAFHALQYAIEWPVAAAAAHLRVAGLRTFYGWRRAALLRKAAIERHRQALSDASRLVKIQARRRLVARLSGWRRVAIAAGLRRLGVVETTYLLAQARLAQNQHQKNTHSAQHPLSSLHPC